jgi:hypothetical protein
MPRSSKSNLRNDSTVSNSTRGIILRGAGLSHLWLDGLALYAMGSILLLIAARRFQNKVIMA